ncbi:SpaA isopeptide-forming pilin-related protein [Vagococcus sp. PNs007]|uniref:SpaA isopeptide-forming pilin-related protein n=1 Tax=Vagococcus proximus TaxID=2991417 RepID=A0ABT5WYN9_9ENTE|nr:SpaA isopeptide-forming pilin-related protein [Vagococcus proximus]MDF0478862.1 SpaA isopeptide-forming pilin-related protein [Vagococcus proximus]
MKKLVKKGIVLLASISILGANLAPTLAASEVAQETNVTAEFNEAPTQEGVQVQEETLTTEIEVMESSESEVATESSESLMNESSEVTEEEIQGTDLSSSDSENYGETETSATEEQAAMRPYKEIEFDFTGEFQREDGTVINSGESVGIHENTRVEYEWSIPDGVEIKEGDTMTFDFPEQLKATGKAEFPITNENGDIIGNAKVDPITGQVVVTFTDYYEKNPEDGRHGTVGFTTKWKEETINVEEDVPLEIGKDGEIIVTVTPPGEGDPNEILQKWGETIENGTKTSWIVRLNYAGQTIKNAVYTDTLGSMQEMIPTEIFGYYGHYDSSGNFIRTSEIPTEQFILSDTGFYVELGDLEKPEASVEIYYNTKNIDEGNSPHYENSGKLTGTNIEEKEITVQTPETGNSGSGTGDNKGIVKVKKVDSTDETKTLAGAEFDILGKDGKVVQHIVTDESGQAKSKNLSIGDYTLVETKAPDGYELDSTPIPVKIEANGEVSVIELTITNDPTAPPLGSIKLTKQDSKDKTKRLAGAEFDVFNTEGEVVGSLITDENGEAILENLPLGDYTIVETKAPDGYELDPTPITVTVLENKESNTVSVTVVNTEIPKKGTIEIIKVDDETGVTLAGAEFDIKNTEGEVVGHIVTDKDGKGSLSDLELGDYTIIETKAPDGYDLSEKVYTISVVENETNTVTIEIENTKIIPMIPIVPGKPVIPWTPIVPGKPVIPWTPIVPGKPVIPWTPIVPGKPVIPWTPIVPGKPVISNKPIVPGKPVIPNKPVMPKVPNKTISKLPQTGERKGSTVLIVLGFVLIGLTSLLYKHNY